MNELVIVNGIIQSKQEYLLIGDAVTFNQAPPAGSTVVINIEGSRVDYYGNGSSVLFPAPVNDRLRFKMFMDEVFENKDNPSVKDALEKLKIVMELVR